MWITIAVCGCREDCGVSLMDFNSAASYNLMDAATNTSTYLYGVLPNPDAENGGVSSVTREE